MRAPRLVIADGHLGIWGAVANVFPTAETAMLEPPHRQRARRCRRSCRPRPATAHEDPVRGDAGGGRAAQAGFQAWATKKGVAAAGHRLEEDWERLVTFYAFPKEHWKHLRTTNVVESPFAAVRLRTGAAKRFKKVENATAVIWKTLSSPSSASVGWTRPSSCRTSPRASCTSTESA